MANVTPTSAANFIPEIWANLALQSLRNEIVLAKLITKDSDITGAFNQGDILHIPFPGTLSANNKAANGTVTLQVPTDSEVQVTLNKHKEASFLIEDVTRAQENQSVMERYGKEAARALAEAIETDCLALYSGFSTSVGTSGTNLTYPTLLSVGKALTDNKAPRNGRFMVLSTKDEAALLNDSNITNFLAYNQSKVLEGSMGHIAGFDLYTSQMVPVVAGSPNSTKNIAGTAEMGILAMRRLPDPPAGSGAVAAAVVDPASGLALRVLMAYNPSYLGVQVTYDVLYGVSELRDACGCVVLS